MKWVINSTEKISSQTFAKTKKVYWAETLESYAGHGFSTKDLEGDFFKNIFKNLIHGDNCKSCKNRCVSTCSTRRGFFFLFLKLHTLVLS